MKKLVKGAAVITVATGLSLWNMDSQKVIAVAPIAEADKIAKEEVQEYLSVNTMSDNSIFQEEVEAATLKMSHLEALHKERVRQQKIAERRERLRQMRLQRMREIQQCCGVRVSDKDRKILERIVEAEAGNQDHKGKLLVANVILNRVKCAAFPSSIQEVVFAHRQFSPIQDGRYYSVTVSADTKSAVEDALKGHDGSQGALYFMDRRYSDSSNVSWFDRCLTRLFSYNGHEFFK